MMEAPKTLITSKPSKRNSFDQYFTWILDTYLQHRAKHPAGSRQVSETNTGLGPRNMRRGGGGVGRGGLGVGIVLPS